MIRVGIVGTYVSPQWMGGVNYLRNLFVVLTEFSDLDIQPILFLPPNANPKLFEMIPKLIVEQSKVLKPSLMSRTRTAVSSFALGHDPSLSRLLEKWKIDIVTHSGHLGSQSKFPTIGWIADLQQVEMPEFFSAKERKARNKSCLETLNGCDLTFLSSNAGRQDIAEFAPEYLKKVRVLNFVSGLVRESDCMPFKTLSEKYNITTPYVYLPNQFWRHKNHAIVINALNILKTSSRACTVIATGHTQDWRQPDHYEKIKHQIDQLGLSDNFRILGLLPGDEVKCLMRNAAAVLNPSLFEGWSTTVEEAKTLGKKILLSDIPVHREQNPNRGAYFDPYDGVQLANLILEALEEYQEGNEKLLEEIAKQQTEQRAKDFGQIYKNVVLEALARH